MPVVINSHYIYTLYIYMYDQDTEVSDGFPFQFDGQVVFVHDYSIRG